MAFWIYKTDRVSKEHMHDYDEWMLCVEGEYIVTIDGVEHLLHAGDELFIPKGSLQGGKSEGRYAFDSCFWWTESEKIRCGEKE